MFCIHNEISARSVYLNDLESSVEDPGHLKHNYVVERVGVVVLHGVDHELGELHVHVFKASISTVKDN